MSKRYMLFVDEEQVRTMVDVVTAELTLAIRDQNQVAVVSLASLLNQLKHPKELRDRPKSIWVQVKEQVLGK